MHALYLYFIGLSFKNTSKALEPFEEKGRSHSCRNLELGIAVCLYRKYDDLLSHFCSPRSLI
jgi:hypothetical protein